MRGIPVDGVSVAQLLTETDEHVGRLTVCAVIDYAGLIDTAAFVARFSSFYLSKGSRLGFKLCKTNGKWYWVDCPIKCSDHIVEYGSGSCGHAGKLDRRVDDAHNDSSGSSPGPTTSSIVQGLFQAGLPLDRPPWKIVLSSCLSHTTAFFQFHHSLADGVSLLSTFMAAVRVSSTEPPLPKTRQSVNPASSPSILTLLNLLLLRPDKSSSIRPPSRPLPSSPIYCAQQSVIDSRSGTPSLFQSVMQSTVESVQVGGDDFTITTWVDLSDKQSMADHSRDHHSTSPVWGNSGLGAVYLRKSQISLAALHRRGLLFQAVVVNVMLKLLGWLSEYLPGMVKRLLLSMTDKASVSVSVLKGPEGVVEWPVLSRRDEKECEIVTMRGDDKGPFSVDKVTVFTAPLMRTGLMINVFSLAGRLNFGFTSSTLSKTELDELSLRFLESMKRKR